MVLFILIISNLFYHAAAQQQNWSEPVNCAMLNSERDEFAPSWNVYEHILYFNSTRTGFSRFYTSENLNGSVFSEPKLLKGDINREQNNQSYISFLSRDEALFSTFRQAENCSYLNIFKTIRKKQTWTFAFVADSLIEDSFNSYPTVSPDGNFIILSSNRNSPAGDMDLWMAFRQPNGTWGGLTNLEELNSPGNDITPFLSSNDTLLFASDGQEGPGGYDIFFSVKIDGIWQQPFPLTSINTEFDESDFVTLPNGTAIFSSNRPGGRGGLDLYMTNLSNLSKQSDYSGSIELSIQTQVTGLYIKNHLLFDIYPVIPIIFFNEVNKPLYDRFYSGTEFVQENIPLLPDSIYYYSLAIIAKRLKNYETSSITLIPNSAPAKITGNTGRVNEMIESVRNFFALYFDSDMRRVITEVKRSAVEYSSSYKFIAIESEDERIFEPIESGTDSINITPNNCKIVLDARPREEISEWRIDIIAGGRTLDFRTGNKLPSEVSIDFINLKEQLWKLDSINISFTALDYLNRKYEKSIILPVSHYLEKEKLIEKTGSFVRNIFYIFALSKENININEEILNIINNTINTKRVIIEYQLISGSSRTEEIADIIRIKILNSLQNKLIPVITSVTKNPEIKENRLYEYIYKIVIEQ